MVTTINITCTDQVLSITNSPPIASGGLNEDRMVFSFCSQWDNFAKTAVFYRDTDHVYHVVLDANGSAVIPHEVTDEDGIFYFGVFGTLGTVTRTSQILKYKVQKGAITEATAVSDPTPSVYEQIIESWAPITLGEIDTITEEV